MEVMSRMLATLVVREGILVLPQGEESLSMASKISTTTTERT